MAPHPSSPATRDGIGVAGGARGTPTLQAGHITGLAAGAALLVMGGTLPAEAQDRDPMLLHDAGGLTVRGHLQFGFSAVSERNLFWDHAARTARGRGLDPDIEWLEGCIRPGLSFEYQVETGAVFHGKLSAVSSCTWGTDAFDTGDTGASTFEGADLALRRDHGTGLSYDLSLRVRELTLGRGMPIAYGAASGFERGALKFGPRRVWEMAEIGRLSHGNVTGKAFYLDPNALTSTDGDNELAGLDLGHADPRGSHLGATFVDALKSGSSYPGAAPGGVGAPTVTPGAREDTSTLNVDARTNPFSGVPENWTFRGDIAYQWKDRIDLDVWAGRATAGYAFANLPWSPNMAVGYQRFSGDDPDTTSLERFDPPLHKGSPSACATGCKSASTDNHLSDNVFLECSRIVNRNMFLPAGVSDSLPGAGIDDLVGGGADLWTGGFINVVFNF